MKSFHLNEGVRLQRYLALCGISSRRKSEDIIKSGMVKVNGKIVLDRAYRVYNGDSVELNGNIIKPEKKIYFVLNKPPMFLCSHSDSFGRKTIYELICNSDKRLFSVGRLDYESSGLIILTNDGDFANRISHPSSVVIKEYYVEADREIPDQLVENFVKGIVIDNITYKAISVFKAGKKIAIIKLNEGKKREIREVFLHFQLKVVKLQRVAIGGLRLENLKLKEGEYRSFLKEELVNLIFK